MGQLKITEMFSSPCSRHPSQRSATPMPSRETGEFPSRKTTSEKPDEKLAQTTPTKRGRFEVHISARSSLADPTPRSASIPSTPLAEMPSSQVKHKKTTGDHDERVLETPKPVHKRKAPSNAYEITPSKQGRSFPLLQGSSPLLAISVSSGAEESEFETPKVMPSSSKKRKITTTQNQQGQSNGRAKGESAISQKPAIVASKFEPTQIKPTISPRPSTASPLNPSAYPAFKRRFLLGSQNSVASPQQYDSDCVIEKVTPSPQRRQQAQSQQQNTKRRRSESNAKKIISAIKREFISQFEDSECEITGTCVSPKKKALTSNIETDNYADDEASDEGPMSSKPKQHVDYPAHEMVATGNSQRFTPTRSIAPPATLPRPLNESPVIDLSQLSTSDSLDSSDDDMIDCKTSADLAQSPLRSGTQRLGNPPALPNIEQSSSPGRHMNHAALPLNLTGPLEAYLAEEAGEPVNNRLLSDHSDDEFFSTVPEHLDDEFTAVAKFKSDEYQMHEDEQVLVKNEHRSFDSSPPPKSSEDEEKVMKQEPLDSADLSSPISFRSSDDEPDELSSSPPGKYYSIPPKDNFGHKSESDTDSSASGETSCSVQTQPDSPVLESQRQLARPQQITPQEYTLQPVYSGDLLIMNHAHDTPASFEPRHRHSLVGLKSILKESKKSWPIGDTDNESGFESLRDDSPQSGDSFITSSPTESTRLCKKRAKPASSSMRKLRAWKRSIQSSLPRKHWKRRLSPFFIKRSQSVPLELTKTTVSSPDTIKVGSGGPKPRPQLGRGWIEKKESMVSLAQIAVDMGHDKSPKSMGSPASVLGDSPIRAIELISPIWRVSPTTKSPGSADSRGSSKCLVKNLSSSPAGRQRVLGAVESNSDSEISGLDEEPEESILEPITNSNSVKPPREVKPSVIRDGVSEHAIKPTIARLENRIAAGEVFNYSYSKTPSQRYKWDIDWSMPAPRTTRSTKAMAAELESRGVVTDTQYSNFWYNLHMTYSKKMGSGVPLFTAKKQALDDFVEEALENEKKRQERRLKAMKRKKEEQEKQPQGVEAFMLWRADETDDESSTEDAVSDHDEDLIVEVQRGLDNQRKNTGGTSCGKRKRQAVIAR